MPLVAARHMIWVEGDSVCAPSHVRRATLPRLYREKARVGGARRPDVVGRGVGPLAASGHVVRIRADVGAPAGHPAIEDDLCHLRRPGPSPLHEVAAR